MADARQIPSARSIAVKPALWNMNQGQPPCPAANTSFEMPPRRLSTDEDERRDLLAAVCTEIVNRVKEPNADPEVEALRELLAHLSGQTGKISRTVH